MPPKGHLKPDVLDAIIRWVMNGMPETADDAGKLFVPPTAAPTATPKP